jgi:5-formyltetrahydrofolate cyclo-ligase
MMSHDDAAHEASSPPCSLHEFANDLLKAPQSPDGGPDGSAVRAWRKAKRTELLAERASLPLRARQERGARVVGRLREQMDLSRYRVLGFYWPIRGEIDLREIARRHIDNGGIVALPVVTAKHAPVEFWQWHPDAAMHVGFWHIPVPADRRLVAPDALLIPLVGFDSAGYRLGYGGGYYDRTLAAATPKPFCIGVAHADAELTTIYPQPHDVPMNAIVTEKGVRYFARPRSVER